MNITPIIKGAASFVVGAGVSTVVRQAIKATLPTAQTKYSRVMVGIGTYAIVGLAANAASKAIEQEIQDASDAFAGIGTAISGAADKAEAIAGDFHEDVENFAARTARTVADKADDVADNLENKE